MKPGVLHFSYAGFGHFRRAFEETGLFSVNLGDYMQTLAVRHLYRGLGYRPEDVVPVDRDRLHRYDGPPVLLPMNACFYPRSLPLPDTVVPLFIGFQARAAVIRKHRAFLARHAPIGCRDMATAAHCRAAGIEADVTGCLTLSLPPRPAPPQAEKGRLFCVYGQGAGALPAEILRQVPPDLLARAEFVSQRREMTRFPLRPQDCQALERITAALLARYRDEALRVLTPLHHAATPCLASGIPVTLCRSRADDRFSWLQRIMDVHVAPDFAGVDWAAPVPDIADIRARQKARFRQLAEAAVTRFAAPTHPGRTPPRGYSKSSKSSS